MVFANFHDTVILYFIPCQSSFLNSIETLSKGDKIQILNSSLNYLIKKDVLFLDNWIKLQIIKNLYIQKKDSKFKSRS
jgi:hypothetical protein